MVEEDEEKTVDWLADFYFCQAERILHASAEGNLAETSRILKLVNELPPPPLPPQRGPRIHATAPVKTKGVAAHKPGAPYPGATPVLSRPYRNISGRRHVPILVTCSAGISFLRFKKPQSPYLSRVIRTKIKWRQKMTDLKERLQDEVNHAIGEDRWDEILRRQHHVGQHQRREPTWTACYEKSLEDHTNAMRRFTWRNNRIASRMREIVDRERELAEVERKERKRAKAEDRKRRDVEGA
ncbi:hypothetical protein GP486_003136 [Trichoglossum hirsutum]|uniref:Uncharacterized protein n=1 Tax=Trichoglossum hirsutum TaxID=265104 RepID=A0A9P8RR25_9PEZI|nr:hypothetical protein GP486_003136 [Trichoglossum hirsutum]